MVNTAKGEPEGLGTLAEEIALAGKFFVPKEPKVTDPGQEQLPLNATAEELVRCQASLDCQRQIADFRVLPNRREDGGDHLRPAGPEPLLDAGGATGSQRIVHHGAGGTCRQFLHEFAKARERFILKPAVQTAKYAKHAKENWANKGPHFKSIGG